MQPKIAIISGSGKFPFLFAKAAKEKGFYVYSIAIRHNTSRHLKGLVDEMVWFKISEFSKMLEFLNLNKIEDVVMAGQINPAALFDKEIFKDEELRKLILGLEDQRADSVFGAIASKIIGSGRKLLDSTLLLKDHLSGKGVFTRTVPTPKIYEDINFGFQMAKEIARLDIGQTVVVKNKAVVAVESMEGTDVTIRRAGFIAHRGCVVVKVSKPKQDMRFDIPVVGLRTIKNMVKIKAACLAIEAEKTLVIDKEDCIKYADRHGLSIVAV